MRIKSLAVLFTAALLAFGGVSAEAGFDKTELKCRKLIAKGYTKALKLGDKASTGCHKDRHSGAVGAGVDCNDLGPEPGSPGAADIKGKFAKAQQKLIDTPAKKCVGLDADVLNEFVSCPEPCNTTLALSNPINGLGAATQCLACMAAEAISTRNTSLLGSPDPGAMSAADASCAQGIGKGYSKYLATIFKTRSKCQNNIEKAVTLGFGGPGLDSNCQSSPDPDGKGKIAKLLAKAESIVDGACGGATLANVGACSTVDIPSLKACAAADSDAADTGFFPAHYELPPAAICPIQLDSVVKAGVRVDMSTSSTVLASGWGGIGHGQDLVDGYLLSTDLTCPNGSPPCGNCTIDGISSAGAQYGAFARCREDTSIECNNPFGTDGVCPGAQGCGYYAGPPLPANSSNVPVCIVARLESDLTGSVNPTDGSGEQNLEVSALVHLGLTLTKPCPRCNNDTITQDGIKDGNCDGGANHGDPCDVQGFNSTFAPAPNSGTSLDCPPALDTNVSGSGLALDLQLTTATSTLPFGTPCDFPLNILNCACAVCTGDGTVTCNSNSDCSDIGAGTCTSKGSGESRQPNGCSDLTCTAGQCLAGEGDDTVTFCDGHVRPNGKGLLTCNFNADCDTVSSVCNNNDCGNCTIQETRLCFNDPISATGTPDPDDPVHAATFCTPPTNNTGVNGATGLPGPSRALIETEATFRY